MKDIKGENALGVEVCLSDDVFEKSPHCRHGPTLLFERYCKEKNGSCTVKKFYACSCCRDRKDCSFFQNADERVSKETLDAREERYRAQESRFGHDQRLERLEKIVRLPITGRNFCKTCGQLLLAKEGSQHEDHEIQSKLSLDQLKKPSYLLSPIVNKKTYAQYLFAEKTVDFIKEALVQLGFNRVLCVGVPRLHEALLSDGKDSRLDTLLLDIDHRYQQFYGKDQFCHYNMFNNHFFGGDTARRVCLDFVRRDQGKGVIMVTDPPFGGLVEILAFSMKRVMKMWGQSSKDDELPTMWIFPYFMEKRIAESFPTFSMLDYKVEYDNHPLYQTSGQAASKHNSPVRLFTNVDPASIPLPHKEGYKYCGKCRRHVSAENAHCQTCDSCTTKDGRTYVHCQRCRKCVKPSWSHCEECQECKVAGHLCAKDRQQAVVGCHLCGDHDHKRRDCPLLKKRTRDVKGVEEGSHKRKARGQKEQQPKSKAAKLSTKKVTQALEVVASKPGNFSRAKPRKNQRKKINI